MPEPACLHIQGRDADPIRVVDLPGVTVRVGRGPFCEVRLNEPDLPDEVCRLRRRGESWQLVPSPGHGGCLTLDGTTVDTPLPLDFDRPFRVGQLWLSLRPSGGAPLSWDPTAYQSPQVHPRPDATAARPPGRAADPVQAHAARAAAVRANRPRPEGPSPRRDDREAEARRWEARWRAIGERVRSARPAATESSARRPSPTPMPAAPVPRPVPARPAGHLPRARETTASTLEGSPTTPVNLAPTKPSDEHSPVEPAASDTDHGGLHAAETGAMADGFSWASPSVSAWLDQIEAATTTQGEPDPRTAPIAASEVAGPLESQEGPTANPVETIQELPPPGPTEIVVADVADPEPTAVEPEDIRASIEPIPARNEPNAPARRLGAARQVAREAIAALDVQAIGVPSRPNVLIEIPPPVEPEPDSIASSRDPLLDTRFVSQVEGQPQVHQPDRDEQPQTSAIMPVPSGLEDQDVLTPGETRAEESSTAGNGPETVAEPRGDWPTVADILRSHPEPCGGGGGSARRPDTRRPKSIVATLTVGRPPAQWSLPLWLGWFPAAAAVAGATTIFGALGWIWATDARGVGIVASRLDLPDPRRKPLPEGVAPGRPAWWATTGSHLYEWGAYLDRTATTAELAEESRALLVRAVEASPLQPGARLVLARPRPGEESADLVRALGQPHDVIALAWTGRQFLSAGKKEAALRAFRDALEMAARTDPARAVVPPFLDDPALQRYALPGEELIAPLVRDLAGLDGLSYEDWAGLVPPETSVPVVIAREFRRRSHPDARRALDVALASAARPVAESGAVGAARLAAQAEALALGGRWAEAEERYRQAIERMPADVVRRAWWWNVADLNLRLNEDARRLEALELAKNDDLKDEITQRAVAIQRASGVGRRDASLRTARNNDAVR